MHLPQNKTQSIEGSDNSTLDIALSERKPSKNLVYMLSSAVCCR